MIILLSPAKIQNFKQDLDLVPDSIKKNFTTPLFIKEAEYLVKLMRKLKADELARLLSINNQLTQLNFDRIFQWQLPFSTENSKQAAFVFDGEVYRGLSFKTFNDTQIEFAQSHLRLLSGLYGILRPLDLIQAYRLEVSSKLENKQGADLYKFWTDKITKHLASQLKSLKQDTILNLASGEYSKSIDFPKLKARVVSPEFFEYKSDKLKQIVIYTKRARGLMASFAIRESITTVDDIVAFDYEGYRYDPMISTPDRPIFVR